MTIVTGIDVGNFDIKSSHTSLPSGYIVADTLPPDTDEYLLFNGKYYIPSQDRFPYRMDKTTDERCLIFTLSSIGKELSYRAERTGDVQGYLNKIDNLVLGAGLPPAHFATFAEKTKDYYMSALSDVEFVWTGYDISFSLKDVKLYPQDYTAVMTHRTSYDVIDTYNDGIVYAIDIGGGTVDYIPIIKGKPEMPKADSIEKGINMLCNDIIQKIMSNTGHKVTAINIENILLEKNSILPDETKDFIENEALNWSKIILDELRSKGMDLWANPAIFLGGGSKLLKRFLKTDPQLNKHSTFIDSPNVNARAYEIATKAAMQTLRK